MFEVIIIATGEVVFETDSRSQCQRFIDDHETTASAFEIKERD